MSANARLYEGITSMLTNVNSSMNANRYAFDALEKEFRRVANLAQGAEVAVHKAQLRYLTTAYRKQYTEFAEAMTLYGLGVTALVFIVMNAWLQGKLPLTAFLAIMAVLGLASAIAFALLAVRVTRRRRAHWRQYYWPSPVSGDAEEEDEENGACEGA